MLVKYARVLPFLSDSSARVTHVPWHYYLDKLGHFSGYPILVVWALGIGVALRFGRTGDRLLLASGARPRGVLPDLSAQGVQLPAPADPTAFDPGSPRCLRRGDRAWPARTRPYIRRTLNGHAPAEPGGALIAAAAVRRGLDRARHRPRPDGFLLRPSRGGEVARCTTPLRNTGVMTISKGSAQYALSFYAKRDAYPYGRFRLATVFPGRKGPEPAAGSPTGPVPRLGHYWPPRLIKGGKVSYLVYYTDEGDDPPEAPIVESEQQKSFRNFIEAYGGQLVHTVRRNHEGRAWIYRVSELLSQPTISFAGAATTWSSRETVSGSTRA